MKFLNLIICIILASHVFAQEEFTPIIPNSYMAYKCAEEITFDGKANEQSWQDAEWTDYFIDITRSETPYFDTRVKIMWDDQFIYFYAEMEEKDICAYVRGYDQVIFQDNDFEIFMKPYDRASHYCEVEVNAIGAVWDLLLMNAYREGGPIINRWNMDHLEVGVDVNGTVNNPEYVDSSWSVEIGLPWSTLDELIFGRRRKAVPEPWSLNFSRVQWEWEATTDGYKKKKVDGKVKSEHNWVWCEQSAVDMHRPEHWGTLYFSDKEPGTEEIPVDEFAGVRQYLFELYREQKIQYERSWINSGEGSYFKHLEGLNPKSYSPIDSLFMRNTEFGFEISAISADHRLTINEQGRLMVKELDPFKFCLWMHGKPDRKDREWKKVFSEVSEAGFTDLFIGGGVEEIKRYIRFTEEYDLNIHAWVWTLNRPGDSVAQQHPDWYAVNREGKNSLEYNAYVKYYQWLSPFSEGARNHIKSQILPYAEIEGLKSIHLDYVRYCDVILGRALQPKYEIIQDKEFPEYDYGYHPNARTGFKEIFGYDPLDLEYPELSTEWRQYRLNAVSTLVNEIADSVHVKNMELSAAVFPFPLMSRTMVRQDWTNWNLDMALPMLYHNFYNEGLDWIGFAGEQGLNEAKGQFPIYVGLYLPSLNPKDLEKAIRLSKKKGLHGVSLFDWNALSPGHIEVLKRHN